MLQRLAHDSPSERLLPRLEGVRSTGHSKWIARCPSHEDKRPSLSIRETGEGSLLIHCHAGCSAVEVLSATGLDMSDLFPFKEPERQVYRRRATPIAPIVATFERDFLLVHALLAMITEGKPIEEADRAAAKAAASRVWNALCAARYAC